MDNVETKNPAEEFINLNIKDLEANAEARKVSTETNKLLQEHLQKQSRSLDEISKTLKVIARNLEK